MNIETQKFHRDAGRELTVIEHNGFGYSAVKPWRLWWKAAREGATDHYAGSLRFKTKEAAEKRVAKLDKEWESTK